MLKGFGNFIMRGNVVDLAVAVVIGGAFGAIVTAFVKDLVTPLIAAFVGKPDFSPLSFTINNSKFAIGDFINVLISFVLVAAAIYFFVVVPMGAVNERRKKPEGAPAVETCPNASARFRSTRTAASSARPCWSRRSAVACGRGVRPPFLSSCGLPAGARWLGFPPGQRLNRNSIPRRSRGLLLPRPFADPRNGLPLAPPPGRGDLRREPLFHFFQMGHKSVRVVSDLSRDRVPPARIGAIPSSIDCMVSVLHELERRDQGRHIQSEAEVYPANMAKLVGVG